MNKMFVAMLGALGACLGACASFGNKIGRGVSALAVAGVAVAFSLLAAPVASATPFDYAASQTALTDGVDALLTVVIPLGIGLFLAGIGISLYKRWTRK
jgi:hypothetical protein